MPGPLLASLKVTLLQTGVAKLQSELVVPVGPPPQATQDKVADQPANCTEPSVTWRKVRQPLGSLEVTVPGELVQLL